MNEAIEEVFSALERAGLEAVVLGRTYEDRAPPHLRLASLAPFARSGLLLVSGGSTFVEAFLESEEPGPDPLDTYTRRLVTSIFAPLSRAGGQVQIRFPFWNEEDPLPFQAIARAAGLAPSILGLDLHPRYGPWIAYRALVLLDRPLPETPLPAFDPCTSCPAPCIEACPVDAVGRGGWDAARCFEFRNEGGCAEGCHARLACPVGAGFRYPDPVLRHFQASGLACSSKSKNQKGPA